jgi:chemotaxis protein histidine kinase CheA
MGILDNKSVQDAFMKEAGNLVRRIEKGLCGPKNASQALRLFRYAHTLKGISGTCGYYRIEEAVKPIAEIFRAAKDGKLEISPKDKVSIKKNLNVCKKLLKKKAVG